MVSQHDEGLAHAGPFDTPQKAIWLYQHARVKDALIELGEKAGIKFPDPEKRESPSKRHHSPAHDIKHRFTVLFFTDRQILERELEDFIEYLPALTDHDDKLEYLLRRLTIACESTIKQKTPGSRPQWPPLSLQEANKDRGESAFAPPSPTMTIKHAPKVGAVDAIDLNLGMPLSSHDYRQYVVGKQRCCQYVILVRGSTCFAGSYFTSYINMQQSGRSQRCSYSANRFWSVVAADQSSVRRGQQRG